MSFRELPVKVIQFGEGNFLRAFIDWMIDVLNEKGAFNGSIAVVQPIEMGRITELKAQHEIYHHIMQGLEGDKKVDELRKITSISSAINPFDSFEDFINLAKEEELELIFSNTTEAGIVHEEETFPEVGTLAKTFPGKLTQLLHARFEHFNGDASKVVGLVPCELIESNGDKLKEAILFYIESWSLGSEFRAWVEKCEFANTLVDRIVPGFPKNDLKSIEERIGKRDPLLVHSESFHLFVMEAGPMIQAAFPAPEYGLNVKYVESIQPYRTQKVRILNGAHTSMVPVGLLNGIKTVSECLENDFTGAYIRNVIYDEIVPTIELPGENPKTFANEVVNRFLNPFIIHELSSIALNSISKFRVRVLPTILDYMEKFDKIPDGLASAFAHLIYLYLKPTIELKDNADYLSFFNEIRNLPIMDATDKVLKNQDLWGMELSRELKDVVTKKIVELEHKFN